MSIKQNFPTIDSSLNLDFANSRVVDSRITFARASAATHTDANGILQTLRNNKPRIDFDPSTGECRGLLIEEQRTNLLLYSSDFSNATWSANEVLVQSNVIVAPDGTLTGDKVIANSTNAFHFVLQGVVIPTGSTFSAYMKAGEYTTASMFLSVGGNVGGVFNLSNGTVTSVSGTGNTAAIISVGNGWYRCSVTCSGDASDSIRIGPDNGALGSFTGNNFNGIYVWGAQVEAGTFPTSYIPTTPTFTSRASSATYYDSTGVLRTAPAGGARYGFGYDTTTQKWVQQGLILEAAATNLMPYSEQFEHSSWSKSYVTVSPNSATAPDSSLNAEKISEDSTTAPHQFGNSPSISLNTTYTLSIYAKAVERSWIILNIFSGTTSCWTWFNISTGVVGSVGSGATARIESVGNGWFRCSLTATTAASGNPNIAFWVSNADTSINYAGTTGSGILVWGAQFETGYVATSYIPTISAATTRAADVSTSAATTRAVDSAIISGTNFSSWYRQDEGTIYNEDITTIGKSYPMTWSIQVSNATADGYYSQFKIGTGTSVNTDGRNGVTFDVPSGVASETVGIKRAFAYKSQNYAAASAGAITGTSASSGVISKMTILRIGSRPDGYTYNGYIKKIVYYPYRLSNTQLQALTV